MASIWVLPCVILSLFSVTFGNVPVLLWESSKSDRISSFPALHTLSEDVFQQYIWKKVHGEQPVPLIAVFEETSLSIEDFSWQDSQGQGYFPQVKYVTETAANCEYLPSVLNPMNVPKQLSKFGYSLQNIDSNEAFDLLNGCETILTIKLEEPKPDEDRPELLRRHDARIAEIYSQLLSKCSHVVAILTGDQPSWVEREEVIRVRRNTGDNSTQSTSVNSNYALYRDGQGFSLLYSKTIPKLVHEGNDIALGNYSSLIVTGDNSKPTDIKLFVKYGNDYRLTFNYDNKTSGYWYLRSIDLKVNNQPDIILRSSHDIYAPLSLSYHCGFPITFRNGSTTLTFSDLQIQPFFLKEGSKSFNDAVDEVGFFTPAIWSGIFVTFLLALIFTWGVSMIMDIRTMDQFDDPKGKTITVSATD